MGYVFTPENVFWMRTINGMFPARSKKRSEDMPMENASGIRTTRNNANDAKKTVRGIRLSLTLSGAGGADS
jgi:hypothetical protein